LSHGLRGCGSPSALWLRMDVGMVGWASL
jgi:hypothetical protein